MNSTYWQQKWKNSYWVAALFIWMGSVCLQAQDGLDLKQYSFHQYSNLDPAVRWSLGSETSFLTFLEMRYQTIIADRQLGSDSPLSSLEDEESGLVSIHQRPLVYPNPFRLEDGARIGYDLSGNGDVEVRIYDMAAAEIYTETFAAGTTGGTQGYNYIDLNTSLWASDLPVGPYFYLLINQQRVIGKGKFVIRP